MLEKATGVTVLRHSTKKPGCGVEVLSYFKNTPDLRMIKPSQIAIVGDRLFTDVMMASMMGSWSIWVKEGVVEERGLVRHSAVLKIRYLTRLMMFQFTKIEQRLASYLLRKGYSPSIPPSDFE